MSFIRTKKIKGNEYAYIVENIWKRRKVKQKTKKYIGRVYRFKAGEKQKSFYEFLGINGHEKFIEENSNEILFEHIIAYELLKHGFQKTKRNLYSNCNCFIDLKAKRVFNEKGNDIALGFNEGFLSGYTIRRILKFKPVVEEDAYEYAKLFVEAGINAPKEILAGVFSKFFK